MLMRRTWPNKERRISKIESCDLMLPYRKKKGPFYPKCKARMVGLHFLSKMMIDKKNVKRTNVERNYRD